MPKQRKSLYAIVHLWIELTRELHRGLAPDDRQDRFGARTGQVLIAAAVLIGTIDGRLMTASKLADYLGIPRPTVLRQLALLMRRGAIERDGHRYRTPDGELDRLAQRSLGAMATLLRGASRKLSS